MWMCATICNNNLVRVVLDCRICGRIRCSSTTNCSRLNYDVYPMRAQYLPTEQEHSTAFYLCVIFQNMRPFQFIYIYYCGIFHIVHHKFNDSAKNCHWSLLSSILFQQVWRFYTNILTISYSFVQLREVSCSSLFWQISGIGMFER